MSHHGLTRNPNDNPVSAGKVREVGCNTLRELGERLKRKIDSVLTTGQFTEDRHFSYVTDDGRIRLKFDLTELANEDRTKEERDQGLGYYSVPIVVRHYIESYYVALGWLVEFHSPHSTSMDLSVGPICKELV